MGEPVETTLEEASRCPRCKEPGRFNGEKALDRADSAGAKIKLFVCDNSRCKWHTTSWTVQVNANGTIPPPLLKRDKQFRKLPDDGGRTLRGLENQLSAETGKNAEIQRRR